MKRTVLAALAMLAVSASSPAWAQFTPPNATTPARPGQLKDSGINTRVAVNPTAPIDTRQTEPPSASGPAKPPSTVPQSRMSKEACDEWRAKKKTEHKECVNS